MTKRNTVGDYRQEVDLICVPTYRGRDFSDFRIPIQDQFDFLVFLTLLTLKERQFRHKSTVVVKGDTSSHPLGPSSRVLGTPNTSNIQMNKGIFQGWRETQWFKLLATLAEELEFDSQHPG